MDEAKGLCDFPTAHFDFEIDIRHWVIGVETFAELVNDFQGGAPWGKVEITTWTHKINGLTESDFILAAKIDQLATAITDEKSRDFQKLMQVVKEAPPQTGSK